MCNLCMGVLQCQSASLQWDSSTSTCTCMRALAKPHLDKDPVLSDFAYLGHQMTNILATTCVVFKLNILLSLQLNILLHFPLYGINVACSNNWYTMYIYIFCPNWELCPVPKGTALLPGSGTSYPVLEPAASFENCTSICTLSFRIRI